MCTGMLRVDPLPPPPYRHPPAHPPTRYCGDSSCSDWYAPSTVPLYTPLREVVRHPIAPAAGVAGSGRSA